MRHTGSPKPAISRLADELPLRRQSIGSGHPYPQPSPPPPPGNRPKQSNRIPENGRPYEPWRDQMSWWQRSPITSPTMRPRVPFNNLDPLSLQPPILLPLPPPHSPPPLPLPALSPLRQHHMFRAVDLTTFATVRAVIIGQDPYHSSSQADGLAFPYQTASGRRASLRNILVEPKRDASPRPSCSPSPPPPLPPPPLPVWVTLCLPPAPCDARRLRLPPFPRRP